MNLEFIGFTLGTIGKLLIAYTAVAVHYRVRKEHKIDQQVFKTMKKEQWYGFAGITLIIAGYLLEIPARFL